MTTSTNEMHCLLDAAGDTDKIVTASFLETQGLGFSASPFHPLTEREQEIFMTDKGFSLKNNAYIRFTRFYVQNGVKYIMLSDDDYSEEDTHERFVKNYNASKLMFTKIAKTFNVFLSADEPSDINNKNVLNEYSFDVLIPLSLFDNIKSQEELEDFFENSEFDSVSDLDKLS